MANVAQKDALKVLARETRAQLGSLAVLVTELFPSHEEILAKSGVTFPEPLTNIVPLEYSICQHVVGMNYLLVVEDALTHPLLVGNKTVHDFGVMAYIGAPVYAGSEAASGAVCAIEGRPRRWSDVDVDLIKSAALDATGILSSKG
ncbi:MAG: GAF domain-containing protein [Paracoccaceae bacterium]